MGSDRPIIVFGCPRSGTTLLQLMLHAHHRIAIPPETRFVLKAYKERKQFGNLHIEANRRSLASFIVGSQQTWFYDLGLDAQEITEEIAAGPPTLGSALGIVFRAYARRFSKPRWGDKHPAYFRYIPALLRLFPDAQLVHLIRDGRDCVASLKTMPWFEQDIYAAVSTWMGAIDSGRRVAHMLPDDAHFELRYEQLVADPGQALAELCEFLGEDFDPAMTQPRKVAPIALPERKVWHARTHEPVTSARSQSWRHRLEPWEISLCETVMGRELRSLGYELSGAPRPSARHLERYARAAALRHAGVVARAMGDRLERTREPGPVAYLL